MICCLMTLVASPALGIKYLSGGRVKENRGNAREINKYQQMENILRQASVKSFMNIMHVIS